MEHLMAKIVVVISVSSNQSQPTDLHEKKTNVTTTPPVSPKTTATVRAVAPTAITAEVTATSFLPQVTPAYLTFLMSPAPNVLFFAA
uniref:Uncharacterized protein n=1 Tax=Strongyloides papillosus TaxID=174720 RepID=A0A0N5B4Z4_STREA